MIDWFKNVFWYIIDRALTAQERYDEARRGSVLTEIYLFRINVKDVDIEPRFLPLVPDRFKIREMCEKVVKKNIYVC